MARPREFDEEAVLDRALALFWARGYESTSIDDLVRETGLGRASLYGAFGDKEALFRRILERYQARAMAQAEKVLTEPSALRALQRLTEANIENACPSDGPRGCLTTLTASLPGPQDERTRALVETAIRDTEQFFTRLVKRGQAEGEITTRESAASLGRYLLVTMQGIATAARMGRPKRELKEVAAQALSLLEAKQGERIT